MNYLKKLIKDTNFVDNDNINSQQTFFMLCLLYLAKAVMQLRFILILSLFSSMY